MKIYYFIMFINNSNCLGFSVLMSVYHKENPTFLKKSVESVLIHQSIKPSELIIVKDGPLTTDLEEIIKSFVKVFSNQIKVLSYPENRTRFRFKLWIEPL